ncbi:MAG: hypothetical protein J6T16_00420 [Opitutales bacterium]|nr:hypothetical protein [Opitutales bacterium]
MKINGQEVKNNGKFAYDGCHKIYIIETDTDETEAIECGYKILEIERIKNTYENSCSLRFIHNWQLTKDHVKQFEPAKFED